MQPSLKQVSPFSVVGTSVRTSNSDEMNATTSQLAGLWDYFYARNIKERIAHREPDSPIYSVYSEYESDRHGRYTTTVGVRVTEPNADHGHTEVAIAGGEYLVFERNGKVPEVVIQLWEEIWKHFETDEEFRRIYETDFEEYTGDNREHMNVAVHIGVRNVKAIKEMIAAASR